MSYKQFTLIERGKLEAFFELGLSTREIGAYLGRHHSSIAREMRRNSKNGEYYATNADDNSRKRRASSCAHHTKFTYKLASIIEAKLCATQVTKADS